MRIRFNGTIEKHSKGCNCKGKQTEVGYVTTKLYILPSGRSMRFYAGKVEEVSEQDGNFLLSYIYKDANGDSRAIFSKVE